MIRYHSFNKDCLTRAIHQLDPVPFILECHPSSHCQLECDYCHSKWYNNPEESVHYSYKNSNSCKKSEYYFDNFSTQLDLDEYRKLINGFTALGGKEIIISGGEEPLLYQNYLELLEIINSFALKPNVYTNGVAALFSDSSMLEKWIKKINTIRVSIHKSTGIDRMHRIINSISNLSSDNKKKISVSLLDDFFDDDKIALEIIREIALLKIKIEIRTIIKKSNYVNDNKLVKYEKYLHDHGAVVINSRSSVNRVSDKCFSPYRNVIVDPYGGIHACCMRSHFGPNDHAYLGSIRDMNINDLLHRYRNNHEKFDTSYCISCSARDYEFNTLILSKMLEIGNFNF